MALPLAQRYKRLWLQIPLFIGSSLHAGVINLSFGGIFVWIQRDTQEGVSYYALLSVSCVLFTLFFVFCFERKPKKIWTGYKLTFI